MTSVEIILICVTRMQFVAILKAHTRVSANWDTWGMGETAKVRWIAVNVKLRSWPRTSGT